MALTGFELVEPVNRGRSATLPGLRSPTPIRSRGEEVAALGHCLAWFGRMQVLRSPSEPFLARGWRQYPFGCFTAGHGAAAEAEDSWLGLMGCFRTFRAREGFGYVDRSARAREAR